MSDKTYTIGLTGQTGAGKSTVACEFKSQGCKVIDCDKISRQVTSSCEECQKMLSDEFGSDIFNKEGELNRKLLAQRAFISPQKTQKLNQITHPFIIAEVSRQQKKFYEENPRAVVLDAPLLFEAGADKLCDYIVAVTASEPVRLARIIKRDSISEECALARMHAQHGEGYYKDSADLVLCGESSLQEIKGKISAFLNRVESR